MGCFLFENNTINETFWKRKPLPKESEAAVLAELRKNLDSFDLSVYYEFFGGEPSKGLPHWSNYKIGFSIMQSYLEAHPDAAIDEWTKLDAEQILKRSEYKYLVE